MSEIHKLTYNDTDGYAYVSPKIAMEEATRCLLCHDAPCSKSCPAGTDPAKFIRSIRFRNVKGAAETIRENNPLAGICARVCPYEKYCEEACSRCGIDKPIKIGLLQQFAVQQEKIYGMKTLQAPVEKNGKKVACIGAGPASLVVAAELAKQGCEVTLYEREAEVGGMTAYGIAPVRLPKEVIDYDVEHIKNLGVKLVLNKEANIDDVKDYDAVFIGTGLWGENLPKIEGVNLTNSFSAVKFLKSFRTSDKDMVKSKKVVVIGGGDVAIDCAVTAKIYGASDVKIVYRRTLEEAPGLMREFQHALMKGISITTGMAPIAVRGVQKVESVEFEGLNNKSDKMVLSTDVVVFATGQVSELTPDNKCVICSNLNEKGLIKTTNGHITEKYFAAGDVVHGAKTVVEAVKAGKEASASIMNFLKKN